MTKTTKPGRHIFISEAVGALTRSKPFLQFLTARLELETGGEDISDFVAEALELALGDFRKMQKLNEAKVFERRASMLRAEADLQ